MLEKCVITGAVRTAIGSYLGSLKTIPVQQLGKIVIQEAVRRSGILPSDVDQVIMGHVLSSTDAPNIARVSGLLAGLREETPAYTVERQCGSGMQAIISALQEIQTGGSNIVIAGGAENMSRAPFYLPLSSRYAGFRLGNATISDSFMKAVENVQPPEIYPCVNMGITAENIAAKYHISREEQDLFALESQKKAAAALVGHYFDDEIVPVEVKDKRNSFVMKVDEYPRLDATFDGLAKLKPAFLTNGTVTAGNSSGMNDGAAAMIVMSESRAQEMRIQPLVRIIDYAVTGVNPRVMGLGPVSAIQKILSKTGLQLDEIDLFEINEAFSAQVLGVLKELGITPESPIYQRINVNGGAVALGHPLGASGARIMTTLIHELVRREARYGLASLCIGGGQGIAMLVERVFPN